MKTKTKRKAAPKKKVEQFTTKAAIKYLRKFFNESTEAESHKLWDILSALRGPDKDGTYFHKEATTGVIRHALFGGVCRNMAGKAISASDSASRLAIRSGFKFTNAAGLHFDDHVRLAFTALGLDFNKVN